MPWLVMIAASTLAAAANLAPRAMVSLGVDGVGPTCIASDAAGNVYAAGTSNNQVLVVKVNPSGTVVYAKAFGGSAYNTPSSIAVDPTGAAYIIGFTQSADFPIVNGYLSTGNMFLTKLSADGSTIVYSTYIGSGTPSAVAVDAAGNAYATGGAASSNFATTSGAFMSSAPLYAESVFVVKVAPDGSKPVWATFLAGNGIACSTLPGVACPLSNPGFFFSTGELDRGSAIAVDAAGSVYIAGSTNSAGFPVTPGVVQTQYADPFGIESQGFVAKLSPDGSALQYSTYLGNAQGESLTALAVDAEGNAIVGGTARQIPLTIKPGWPSSPLPQFNGGFVAKLDAQAATIVYTAAFGEGGFIGIAVDTTGNAYATAGGTLPSFPVTPGGISLTGYSEAFVELDRTGATIYSTELPYAGPITVTANSVALITGTALTIFRPSGAAQPAVFALQSAASLSIAAEVVPGEILLVSGTTQLITFNGVPAPVLHGPPLTNQALIQVPFEIAGQQQTTIAVSGSTQSFSIPVTAAQPAVFMTPGYGVTTPLNSDASVNSPANPAKFGTYMTIFITGAGSFQGGLGTGDIAPLTPLFAPQLPVSVQIFSGNNPRHNATVLYAGSAPTQSDGVMQINFLLPVAPDLHEGGAFIIVQVGAAQTLQTLIAVTN